MTLTQSKRRACLLPQTSFGYRAFATSLSMCRTKNEPLSTQLVPNLPHGFTGYLPTWILPKLTLSGLAARRLPLVEAEAAPLRADIRKTEIANTMIGSREVRRGNDMDMNCEPSSSATVWLGRAFPNSEV